MLLKWKRVSAVEYVAAWQDEAFQLVWEPNEHRWQAFVNSLRVKHRWQSIPMAMDACENALNRYITRLSTKVTAKQRSLSSNVFVRTEIGHVGSRNSNFKQRGTLIPMKGESIANAESV